MTNLDSILKRKDTTLPTKVCLVKAMVFPIVIYGCENWKTKLSIEELMLLNCGVGEDCWQSLELQRRSNQSIPKEISPEFLFWNSRLMLKLKLQYAGHLMQRTDSLEKTLMLGKTEGRRRRGHSLIQTWASPSPAFRMMYSAYKLNKQGDNIQPWRTPFLIWNHSIIPCPVLTVASWPACRFLRRQVRWSGIFISKNFP